MKTIKTKEIESKVKETYKEVLEWCNSGYNRNCDMMIDTENARIWANFFMDEFTWKVYDSDSIHRLSYSWIPFATDAEKEQGYIDDAIQQLQEAGWTIVE